MLSVIIGHCNLLALGSGQHDHVVVQFALHIAMDSNSDLRVGGVVQLLLIRLGEIPHGLVGIIVRSPGHDGRDFIVGIPGLDVVPRVGRELAVLRHVRGQDGGIVHQHLVGTVGESVGDLQTRLLKSGHERSDEVVGRHLHERPAEQLGVVVLPGLDVARDGQGHVGDVVGHHVAPVSRRVPPLLEGTLGAHVEPAEDILPHGEGMVALPLGPVLGRRSVGADVRHPTVPLGRVAVDEHIVGVPLRRPLEGLVVEGEGSKAGAHPHLVDHAQDGEGQVVVLLGRVHLEGRGDGRGVVGQVALLVGHRQEHVHVALFVVVIVVFVIVVISSGVILGGLGEAEGVVGEGPIFADLGMLPSNESLEGIAVVQAGISPGGTDAADGVDTGCGQYAPDAIVVEGLVVVEHPIGEGIGQVAQVAVVDERSLSFGLAFGRGSGR
mmetsp:Transcript_10601/g.24926  ORF Transcript_10601/g.24926 Transcript_10601/m.24926 type:complete len:437 (+) Transcript_10601:323-1633(+)